jgi:hypothetical protein
MSPKRSTDGLPSGLCLQCGAKLISGAAFCSVCGSFADVDHEPTIENAKKTTAHSQAVETALAEYWRVRITIAACGVAALAVIILFVQSTKTVPAPVANGTPYAKPETMAAPRTYEPRRTALPNAEAPKVAHKDDDSDRNPLPSALDNKIVEDGRTYSVALVAASRDIPIGTQIFAQGIIVRFGYASVRSRPYAILRDEDERDRTVLCAMTADEGEEVISLYHIGETVQLTGEYMGTAPVAGNESMPMFSGCRIASPTNNVVRSQTQRH